MSNKSEQPPALEQAFKQFSLESERLEWIYQNLESRFNKIQENVKESNLKLSSKLSELDFVTHYLETILDHTSQGMLFIDLNHIVTTYNAAAEQILAIPESQLLFHLFSDYFNDDFFGFSLNEALKSKVCPKKTVVNWIRSDDKKIDLEIETSFVAMNPAARPLDYRQPDNHAIHGLLILIRNVTELRQLQLIASRNDLLKELGEMAAHMAHEIRNPLGGIKGFATLLEQDLQDRPDLQQMAHYIVEGTDNLNRLVTAILQYTRPFQPQIEQIELIEFLEEIKRSMQADLTWNPKINFRIESKLPKLLVSIDSQLFRSALLNLFVNGAQAMPDGGELTVKVNLDREVISLKVSDTGMGIQKEDLSKIFSPFFTTKQTGTGLGLPEVYKVIQAHHGSIEVHSDVGQGTVFEIKIPIIEEI